MLRQAILSFRGFLMRRICPDYQTHTETESSCDIAYTISRTLEDIIHQGREIEMRCLRNRQEFLRYRLSALSMIHLNTQVGRILLPSLFSVHWMFTSSRHDVTVVHR